MSKIPPHDDAAEKGVIGAGLLHQEILKELVSMGLTGADFYDQKKGIVFDTMSELDGEGTPIDLITMQNRIREKGLPEFVDMAFISNLLEVTTSANYKEHARIVMEKAKRRRLIKSNEEAIEEAYQGKALASIADRQGKEIASLLQNRQAACSVESFADLFGTELEKPAFAVEGLISVGFNVLAAPPKFGKSWFCLQLGIAMQRGENFLGFRANKGEVIYLALEDSKYRLQDRLKKLGARSEDLKGFSYCLKAPDLDHGLLDEMALMIKPETKLIIIDTLQKIRGAAKRSDGAYANDYREIAALQSFALEHGIALLAVHHTRKMSDASDSFSNVSGTNGITGGADALLVISRKNRMDREATLSTTGRDIDAEEIQIKFENCRWVRLGLKAEIEEQRAREEYERNPVVKTIRKFFESSTEWNCSAKEFVYAASCYGFYVKDSAQGLSKQITELEERLFEIDGISHITIKNGSGGKKHKFTITKNH